LVSLLSAFVKPLIDNTLTYPERVYISRAGATSRRVRQEHELEAALHQQGYATIKLEDLTWQEQINLFFHAREICAPHGAGLANLVFCSRKPLVVELFPATYVHWCFWKLARLVGADYVPFAFPYGEVEHRNGGAHIDIDPSDVSMIVKAVRRYR
jgi:capsular polysaccharide biosynthesis protein